MKMISKRKPKPVKWPGRRGWKKWDALDARLRNHKGAYARVALREARAVLGPKFNKPPLRMAVQSYLDVDFAVALAWSKYDLADYLAKARKAKAKRKRVVS